MIKEEDIELYIQWQRSPVKFVQDMWGLEPQPLKLEYKKIALKSSLQEYKAEWFQPFIWGKHITWQQWVILLAVEKALRGEASKRITVKSGRGIGKDATLSWLILWWLFCYKDSQIPCTAPTSQQIYDILWKEIAVWLNRMPKQIRLLYEWQTKHIRMVESPETWFARAQTAKKENPEALAGVHGRYIFLASDEASGVDDIIYKTAEGSLTGKDYFFIMISNPTRLTGYFYDSHNADSKNWQCLTFNSEESPIVEKEFIDRIIERYGKDSDEYRVQVLGLFPKQGVMDERGYLPLLNEADLTIIPDTNAFIGAKRMGIDCAGTGRNKSAWALRDNFKLKIVAEEKVSTPKSIAERTLNLLRHYRMWGNESWLDNLGEGANASREIALVPNISESLKRVNAVSFNDEPEDKEKFLNKRAEMYWRLREWIRRGGQIVRDDELIKQLLSIKYKINLRGRIQIMSKEEMRKAGIASPDKADAAALTFYKKEETEKKQRWQQPEYVPKFEWEGAE